VEIVENLQSHTAIRVRGVMSQIYRRIAAVAERGVDDIALIPAAE
jgi:hypothetical protein